MTTTHFINEISGIRDYVANTENLPPNAILRKAAVAYSLARKAISTDGTEATLLCKAGESPADALLDLYTLIHDADAILTTRSTGFLKSEILRSLELLLIQMEINNIIGSEQSQFKSA